MQVLLANHPLDGIQALPAKERGIGNPLGKPVERIRLLNAIPGLSVESGNRWTQGS
jgi:hypothetical protein